MFPHQSQTIEKLNHIRITQSLQGVALPIVFGTQRVPGLLVWNGDFVASKHNPSGGKGFGGKGGALYTYVGSWQSALCQGPIGGIRAVWDNEGQYVPQGQLNNFTIPPPTPVAPTLSQVTSGALAATTYFVKVTYVNAGGQESSSSPESSLAVLVNNVLVVTSPAAATSATGWNVYVSTTTGTEQKQNTTAIAIGTNFQEPNSGLVVGATVPAGGQPRGPIPDPQWSAPHGISFGGSPYNRRFYDYNGGFQPPTLNSGEFSVDGSGNYTFSNSDAGRSVAITDSFFYNNLITQEVHVIPASTPFTFTGNQGGLTSNSKPIFVADFGVRFQTSGTALVKVGSSPGAGQYSVSISAGVGTYTFNSADASKAVIINYEWFNFHDDKFAPRTLATTFFPGLLGQAAWSYLASAHPDQVVSYSQTAYSAFQKAYLGMSAAIPVHSYEIIGFNTIGGGVLDASPVDALKTLLTDPDVGIGYPLANVDNNTWFSNTNSAQNWCKALSLFISDALLNQETVASVAGKWMEAFQIATFFSEGLLKMVPFGDQNATSTLATYTANTGVVATLTDNDFIPPGKGKDPITTNRSPWTDAYNRVQVNYQNRFNSYNEDFVYEQDEASVGLFGLRIEAPVTYSFIPSPATAAAAANMRLKRSVQIRNKYQFRLSLRYEYLEPMDLVNITDSRVGISNQTVRIISVENDVKKGLTIEAEDFPGNGYAMPVVNPKWATPRFHPPHGTNSAGATNALIVEATAKAQTVEPTSIYIYCTGDNPYWGGCTVWVSLDGTNFSNIGTVTQPARVGQLYGPLGAIGPNPSGSFGTTTDTVNTLQVDISSSLPDQNQIGITAWSSTAAYVKGNFVTYDGFLWGSLNSHTNSIPTISNSDWQLISGVGPAGGAVLSGVTAANAQSLGTISAVISTGSAIEFLSYQNVNAGTQANQYNLTTLYRGAYGTTISSFPTGSLFVRFKDASLVYQLPAGFFGKTIYFRFTAANALGGSTQNVANAPTLSFVVNSSGNGAAKFGWTNLDDVPDGNNFGRPPISQYGKLTPIGKLTGFEVLSNPDFELALQNWGIYDNNNSGSVTLTQVADTASPNGMGTKLKITELRVGAGPTPGLGGFFYATALDNGTIQADGYHVGDTYIIDLLANIPVGYTLNFASNTLGTGGTFQWLNGVSLGLPPTPPVGTGNWQHYISRVVIGPSPSTTNAFPFFYLTGAEGVTWYVAHMVILDINQKHRHGGVHTHVGTHGNKFGHTSDIFGTGYGTLFHQGNHRTFLDTNPGYGFYGVTGGDASVSIFQPGTRNLFKTSASGAGPWHIIQEDTSVNGKTLASYKPFPNAHRWYERSGGTSFLHTTLDSPQFGFQGTPTSGFPIESFSTINTANPIIRATNNDGSSFGAHDTEVNGREYSFNNAQIGGGAVGNVGFGDNTAATARTLLNSTPQFGFYGSPAFDEDLFGQESRITKSGATYFNMNDTEASGRSYKMTNANAAVGVFSEFDGTAVANRTFLNSTPNYGIFGTPGTEFDVQGHHIQATGADAILWANDTGTSGVRSWFTAGDAGAGLLSIAHNNSTRTILNSNPSWGFYGSPASIADVDVNGGSAETFMFHSNVNGAGPWVGYYVNTTTGGGAWKHYHSGATQEWLGGSTNVAQVNYNSPQWGYFGSPAVPVEILAGGTDLRMSGTTPAWNTNDTQASGRGYGFQSGGSAVGIGNRFDATAGAFRTYLNSTPQLGVFGSPGTVVDFVGGGDGNPVRYTGSKPSFRVNNTDASGRAYEFNAGNNTAGFMEIIDRSSNVMRWNMDSSGNADFAAGTPVTGIGAAGVAFADLSANLKLKNINTAVGTTNQPTTSSTTYAVVPEMTITITTKGNKVLIFFISAFSTTLTGTGLNLAFFRDGSQISSDYLAAWTSGATGSWNATGIGWIDNPSAASHTFDIRWKITAGAGSIGANGIARTLQAVELG